MLNLQILFKNHLHIEIKIRMKQMGQKVGAHDSVIPVECS